MEMKYLNKPSEMHKTQILVRLLLGEDEIGRAVAANKKEAAELASEAALNNENLEHIMEKVRSSS